MGNRIKVEFMDGRVIFFDDDPDSRFDCDGNRVRVFYQGEWHWFDDVKYCNNTITLRADRIILSNPSVQFISTPAGNDDLIRRMIENARLSPLSVGGGYIPAQGDIRRWQP